MSKMSCFEKITSIVLVSFANLIISLSLIDPDGWITAETPDWISFSIPSTNGKKASEAATISIFGLDKFFHFVYCNLTTINLLGWPDPIPIVDVITS